MFFHLILTGECNLQCTYCYGEATEDTDGGFEDCEIDYSLPRTISYDIKDLKSFCAQDPECVLTFYGGEPLLRIEQLKQIIDKVPAKHFMIQTNGLLLDRLEADYVNRFHTVLVSVDGDKELTDYYRGKGTFEKVKANLKLIRKNGFKGELLARMTVDERTDIYKQVTWLLNHTELGFDSVHWQLNAGFWNDFARRDFEAWLRRSYSPGIQRLCNYWVDQMEDKGYVPRIYPFLGIADSFLTGEKTLLRCGSGWINYAIQTDGKIIICPALWGVKNHYIGDIFNSDHSKLRQIHAEEPCKSCDILGICGGRCLYANLTQRWPPSQYSLVCDSVRNLVNGVAEIMPRINQLIKNGRLEAADFRFLKYNGCEIIP